MPASNFEGGTIEISPAAYSFMSSRASEWYGRGLGDLSLSEVWKLITSIVPFSTEGMVIDDESGSVVVDSELDGKEALRSALQHNMAKDAEPETIRELTIQVLHNKRLWHRILGREPTVKTAFHYSDSDTTL